MLFLLVSNITSIIFKVKNPFFNGFSYGITKISIKGGGGFSRVRKGVRQ